MAAPPPSRWAVADLTGVAWLTTTTFDEAAGPLTSARASPTRRCRAVSDSPPGGANSGSAAQLVISSDSPAMGRPS